METPNPRRKLSAASSIGASPALGAGTLGAPGGPGAAIPSRRQLRVQAARARPFVSVPNLLLLMAAHGMLGIAMFRFELLATAHALLTLVVGLRLANGPTYRAIYVCGYVATADVLWRMTSARVFWEFGKYGLVVIILVILLRQGSRTGLIQGAAAYFAMLLPSAVLTVDFYGLERDLRNALSFNLSGPFALAASVVFFSGLRHVERLDPLRLLTWMVMPIVGVFGIAAYSTLTATRIVFTNQANFVTSGGFGPNQVSAILSLGTFLGLLLALHVGERRTRFLLLAVAGGLQLQSLLTFSRGGTFNLLVALAFLAVHYLQHRRVRKIFLGMMLVVGVLGTALVLPRLNSWTAGNFSQRFTNIDTTGRADIAEADLQLFRDNPILGVGPGMAKFRRQIGYRYGLASHTEFTRLLAEHGLLGMAAIGMMLVIAIQAYARAPTALTKGWVAGFAAWSMAEMTHSAMRIVAISFVFGLATLPFHRLAKQRASAEGPHAQDAGAKVVAAGPPPPGLPRAGVSRPMGPPTYPPAGS
ncbi:MAG: O-antigen ligase family protein [Holophagales bacterium]|nr:O-antigen ligase family protein [Holophagales bacterium]